MRGLRGSRSGMWIMCMERRRWGGRAWMYLSPVEFEQAGFLKLGTAAPPVLTEAIQHGVFKYWIAPVGWYSVLGFVYWVTGRRIHREGAKDGYPLKRVVTRREGRGEGEKGKEAVGERKYMGETPMPRKEAERHDAQ